MASDAILERLKLLHPKLIDLSLERIVRLLAALGNPERALPPVIHVAGTNGKGSTCAYLRAMLEAAGHRVHMYTSPHLVRFHERIRIATGPGQSSFITEAELSRTLEDCERANGGLPITFFEITTAAAFVAFARHPADAIVLEVGLGGLLDATNVLDAPARCVITPVSIDHVNFLGPHLPGIAREKAGILKRGVTAAIAPQVPEALAVIEARAAEVGAPLLLWERDWSARASGERLTVTLGTAHYDLPLPALPGRHQFLNAGLTVAALHGFTPRVPTPALARGLREVDWPARMQRLAGGRLAAQLPATADLWLDGGHNPGAAEVIADMLRGWAATDGHPVFLVCGMLETKDAGGFFAPLAGLVQQAFTLTIPGQDASLTGAQVAAAANTAGVRAQATTGLAAALTAAAGAAGGKPARVLVCGSLYLAGHVLEADGRPPV